MWPGALHFSFALAPVFPLLPIALSVSDLQALRGVHPRGLAKGTVLAERVPSPADKRARVTRALAAQEWCPSQAGKARVLGGECGCRMTTRRLADPELGRQAVRCVVAGGWEIAMSPRLTRAFDVKRPKRASS